MRTSVNSSYLNLLKNRINLSEIPFSDRGSRLLIFYSDDQWIFTDREWIPLDLDIPAAREKMQ